MGYQNPPPPPGAKRPPNPPAYPPRGTGLRVCRDEDIFMPSPRDEKNMEIIEELQRRIGQLDMRVERLRRNNDKLRQENLELKDRLLMVDSPVKSEMPDSRLLVEVEVEDKKTRKKRRTMDELKQKE